MPGVWSVDQVAVSGRPVVRVPEPPLADSGSSSRHPLIEGLQVGHGLADRGGCCGLTFGKVVLERREA
jgi:hypothetical protein